MKRLTIRSLVILPLSVVFLCSMAVSASALIMTYDNETDWKNAAGSILTEDFNDGTLNPGIEVYSQGSGTVADGVLKDLVRSSEVYETTISFSPEILAWGAYFDFGYDGVGEGINIALSSEGTLANVKTLYNPDPNKGFQGFFGFTSSLPFDKIVLAGAHQFGAVEEEYTLDNMKYAPVPEPATMLLLGSGLVGLAGFGRKKLFS